MPYLLGSNYDRQLYRKQFWQPSDTDDLEDHPYGPEDPWALPQ